MSKRERKDFEKVTTPDIEGNVPEEGDVIDQTQNFIQKNGTLISIVSVAIIIIVAAFVYFTKQAEESKINAADALSRVHEIYESGNYEVALNGDPNKMVRGEAVLGLVDIVDEFSGTEQGKLAALYAGNSYFALGDFDNAKNYFNKATDSEAKVTRRGANAGIAACMEEEGEFGEAASYYEKAANLSFENDIKFRYMYFAGLNYEKNEKKDKAVKLYKDIVLMSERSQYADEAKVGLARLGTVIE